MEEMFKIISTMSDNICSHLGEIRNILDKTDYFVVIAPWILSIVSGIVGFHISSANERRAFKRNSHINYLSFTNDFKYEINKIITEINNIQQIAPLLLNDIKPNFHFNMADYYSVFLKIQEFRTDIENLNICKNIYSIEREYQEKFISQSNDILDYNKFIEICSTFERKAANYYYLISVDLREEYCDIIDRISIATRDNMKNFNIVKIKLDLDKHIINVNKKIIGRKIKKAYLSI